MYCGDYIITYFFFIFISLLFNFFLHLLHFIFFINLFTFIFSFLRSDVETNAVLSSATQYTMPPELGGKWGTECLNTRFPVPKLLWAGYSVKLIQFNFNIFFIIIICKLLSISSLLFLLPGINPNYLPGSAFLLNLLHFARFLGSSVVRPLAPISCITTSNQRFLGLPLSATSWTPRLPRMNVLRMRSDLVTPHTPLSIFISVTWSSWVCRDSVGQHSLSYKRTGRMMLLCIRPLSLGGILRSQSTSVTSRHLALAALIQRYNL